MNIGHSGFNPVYSESQPTVEQIRNLSGNALLEFGAPWCGYCKGAEPALRQVLTEQYPQLTHIKVYDGKGKVLGRAFRVTLWPTLILLHDGTELDRVVRPATVTDIDLLLQKIVR